MASTFSTVHQGRFRKRSALENHHATATMFRRRSLVEKNDGRKSFSSPRKVNHGHGDHYKDRGYDQPFGSGSVCWNIPLPSKDVRSYKENSTAMATEWLGISSSKVTTNDFEEDALMQQLFFEDDQGPESDNSNSSTTAMMAIPPDRMPRCLNGWDVTVSNPRLDHVPSSALIDDDEEDREQYATIHNGLLRLGGVYSFNITVSIDVPFELDNEISSILRNQTSAGERNETLLQKSGIRQHQSMYVRLIFCNVEELGYCTPYSPNQWQEKTTSSHVGTGTDGHDHPNQQEETDDINPPVDIVDHSSTGNTSHNNDVEDVPSYHDLHDALTMEPSSVPVYASPFIYLSDQEMSSAVCDTRDPYTSNVTIPVDARCLVTYQTTLSIRMDESAKADHEATKTFFVLGHVSTLLDPSSWPRRRRNNNNNNKKKADNTTLGNASNVTFPSDNNSNVNIPQKEEPWSELRKLDMANTLHTNELSNVVTFQSLPNIKSNSMVYKVLSGIVVGLVVLYQLWLLLVLCCNLKHKAIQLSQGPVLVALMVCCIFASASSYLLLPLSNSTCLVREFMILLPLTMCKNIMLARMWRICALLRPVMRIGRTLKSANQYRSNGTSNNNPNGYVLSMSYPNNSSSSGQSHNFAEGDQQYNNNNYEDDDDDDSSSSDDDDEEGEAIQASNMVGTRVGDESASGLTQRHSSAFYRNGERTNRNTAEEKTEKQTKGNNSTWKRRRRSWTQQRRSCDDILMEYAAECMTDHLLRILSFLADYERLTHICHQCFTNENNGRTIRRTKSRKGIRQNIPLSQLFWLAFVLSIPQFVLQLCGMAIPSLRCTRIADFNETLTEGRYECSRSSGWIAVTWLGAICFLIPSVLVAILSLATKDYPTLFNEAHSMKQGGKRLFVVFAVFVPLLVLTEDPSIPSEVTAFLWMSFILFLSSLPIAMVVVPKLKIVWRGDTVVLTGYLSKQGGSGGSPSGSGGVGGAAGGISGVASSSYLGFSSHHNQRYTHTYPPTGRPPPPPHEPANNDDMMLLSPQTRISFAVPPTKNNERHPSIVAPQPAPLPPLAPRTANTSILPPTVEKAKSPVFRVVGHGTRETRIDPAVEIANQHQVQSNTTTKMTEQQRFFVHADSGSDDDNGLCKSFSNDTLDNSERPHGSSHKDARPYLLSTLGDEARVMEEGVDSSQHSQRSSVADSSSNITEDKSLVFDDKGLLRFGDDDNCLSALQTTRLPRRITEVSAEMSALVSAGSLVMSDRSIGVERNDSKDGHINQEDSNTNMIGSPSNRLRPASKKDLSPIEQDDEEEGSISAMSERSITADNLNQASSPQVPLQQESKSQDPSSTSPRTLNGRKRSTSNEFIGGPNAGFRATQNFQRRTDSDDALRSLDPTLQEEKHPASLLNPELARCRSNRASAGSIFCSTDSACSDIMNKQWYHSPTPPPRTTRSPSPSQDCTDPTLQGAELQPVFVNQRRGSLGGGSSTGGNMLHPNVMSLHDVKGNLTAQHYLQIAAGPSTTTEGVCDTYCYPNGGQRSQRRLSLISSTSAMSSSHVRRMSLSDFPNTDVQQENGFPSPYRLVAVPSETTKVSTHATTYPEGINGTTKEEPPGASNPSTHGQTGLPPPPPLRNQQTSRGRSAIVIRKDKPLPSKLLRDMLRLKPLLEGVLNSSMAGIQPSRNELESLRLAGRKLGHDCERIQFAEDEATVSSDQTSANGPHTSGVARHANGTDHHKTVGTDTPTRENVVLPPPPTLSKLIRGKTLGWLTGSGGSHGFSSGGRMKGTKHHHNQQHHIDSLSQPHFAEEPSGRSLHSLPVTPKRKHGSNRSGKTNAKKQMANERHHPIAMKRRSTTF